MKNTFILFFLLTTHFVFSKTAIVNDTLAKLSFEDLRLRLVENIEDEKFFKIYVNYYIKKAKKEDNVEALIKGYGFKVENYPFKEALKYADSMSHLVKNKSPKQLFLYYYKLGNLYSGNRKNKKALDYYLIAYNNCDKNDEDYYNAIKMQIGVMRSTLGQYQEAITILKETENYFKEKSPAHYLFQQYIMAEAYNSMLELETAKTIIDRGLALAKKEKSELMIDRFLTTKGVNLYGRKEYQNAINLLIPILKNASFVKEDFSDYAFVSYYIGKSYDGLKNKDLTLKYFKKVDSVFVKYNDIYDWNIDSYKFLIDFYKEKKDLKNQLVYTERLIKADSLLMASNEYGLKSFNKGYDIPNLISEKQELITNLKKKESFSYSIIALLFLVIIRLAYYYYENKKRAKQKIELLRQNLENYLNEQQKTFEDKNKHLTLEESTVIESSEIQRKMSGEAKNGILNNLDLFEKKRDFLKNTCSLDNLAKEFNTNKTYLSKIINEDKGYSFSAYVSNLRIEYLVEQLKQDKRIRKYSIDSIAEEIGYNNAKAFSRAFYDRIGMNPSVFIKNMND